MLRKKMSLEEFIRLDPDEQEEIAAGLVFDLHRSKKRIVLRLRKGGIRK